MKNIRNFDLKNKRVLVRCDFNVPLDESGNILDDAKIKEALPTLKYLIEHRAKIIILTHLGEPEGKVVNNLRLDKIRDRIEKLLDIDIMKSFDCMGRDVENQASRLKMGEMLLLENVRFHKEEMENNTDFAKKISILGDIYINEAFDVCHRNHASVVGIPQFLPHGTGFALQKEVKVLSQIMQRPLRPMVAIIGGAKASTKAKFVEPFTAFADVVIVNGLIKQELTKRGEYPRPKYGARLASPLGEAAEKVLGPKDNLKGLDLTVEDIKKITSKILHAKTVFWNGPFGKFEDKRYAKGTGAIANAIIESKAFSVVGGGETIEFLKKEGIVDKFSHVSTAGGAMLNYLAGEPMPGLEALDRD